jgi:hypothetical protein
VHDAGIARSIHPVDPSFLYFIAHFGVSSIAERDWRAMRLN